MAITPNATAPKKGKSATVHNFEFARVHSTLKKTPDHRKQKCRELLHEQALLESRLRTVRSMLDAVTNTDRPVCSTGAVKSLKQANQANPLEGVVDTLGRI